jgi:hypothetical protein
MKEIKNKKGQLHNLDGPAVINGCREEWRINGELHREDGPAVIIKDDIKEWYLNGKRHRKAGDGPAYINKNYNFWYIDDIKHIKSLSGKTFNEKYYISWWLNGERHREDGPAVINGNQETWYINDIEKNDEWVKRYLKIKNKHTLLGVIVRDKWRIREIILRWRYNPNFKCVKNRIEREYNFLY